MSTNQTMRQLLDKVTPGPWVLIPAQETEHQCFDLVKVAEGRHITPEGNSMAEANANAQYIARLSPDTIRAVLELAEEINRDAWSDDRTRMRVIARTSDELLSLLNASPATPKP